MRRLVLALAFYGCSSPPAPVTRPTTVVVADAGAPAPLATIAPARPPPAKWLPSAAFVDIGGARRGAIVADRRVVLEELDDATKTTRVTVIDSPPIVGLGPPHRVPEALGGGWVFVGRDGVWTARAFEGPLVTIMRGPVRDVGFGIDRVFVDGETYELATGKSVPPPVPDTVELFGLGSGQVVARTKKDEVYYSPAKGKPFLRVAKGIGGIAFNGLHLVLLTSNGHRQLYSDGRVGAELPPMPGLTSRSNLLAIADLPNPLDLFEPKASNLERMLAPLSVTMDDGKVVRVDGDDLEVFDGDRGVVVTTQKGVFALHQSCVALRGGTPAFVQCSDEAGTVLFRLDAFDRPPSLEKQFPSAVMPDFGFPVPGAALVFAAGCDGRPTPGTLCVRRDETSWADITLNDPEQLLPTIPLVAAVMSTPTGVPYGFGFRRDGKGLVMLDGATRTVRAIPKAHVPAWAWPAIRWRAATVSDGKVRFLLEGEQPGVMTIDGEGKVEARSLEGTLAAVGERGLLVAPDGQLRETIDAGRTWHALSPPPGGIDAKNMRCAEAGCTLGAWHRLGWRH